MTFDVSMDPLEAEIAELRAENERLRVALREIVWVIETDALIPESVSYMQQARAALAAS